MICTYHNCKFAHSKSSSLILFRSSRGDCATCQINLAGRYVRCCTGKVPEEPKLKSLQEKGLEIKG